MRNSTATDPAYAPRQRRGRDAVRPTPPPPDVVSLLPGQCFATAGRVLLRTILGSCVSACLYDPVSRVVGMNHFLLSDRRSSSATPLLLSEAGRYGIHAMELLINGMMRLGARRENLRSKAFGGGALLKSRPDRDRFVGVGRTNQRFVLEFLEREAIPLVSADLGGRRGRVIEFSSEDYSVQLKRLRPMETPALVRRERALWLERLTVQQQGSEIQEPEIW